MSGALAPSEAGVDKNGPWRKKFIQWKYGGPKKKWPKINGQLGWKTGMGPPCSILSGWCSTPTLLLICSSFSRENDYLLLICSSLSTSQFFCWEFGQLTRGNRQICNRKHFGTEEFCSGWFATCTVYAILLMEEILSCTSWYEEYAIFHRFSKITGGVGFLPATVWTKVPKLSQVKNGLMIALISHPTLKMGIKRSYMWFSEAEKGMLTRKLIQSYYWWKKSG